MKKNKKSRFSRRLKSHATNGNFPIWVPRPQSQWLFGSQPEIQNADLDSDGEVDSLVLKDFSGNYDPPLGLPLQKGYIYFDGVVSIQNNAYNGKTITSYDVVGTDPQLTIGGTNGDEIISTVNGGACNILLSDGTFLRCEQITLNGGDGSTIVADASGNGNHGALLNATLSTNLQRTDTLTNSLNIDGYNIYATDDLNTPIAQGASLDPAKTYIPVGRSEANHYKDAFGSTLLNQGKSRFLAPIGNFPIPQFDGSAYVDMGSIDYVNDIGTGDFTIGCFFSNVDSAAIHQVLIGKGIVADGSGFELYIFDSTGEIYFVTRAAGSGNAIKTANSYYNRENISVLGYIENGVRTIETNEETVSDTEIRDVSGDYSTNIGSDSYNNYRMQSGNIWACFVLNRAMTSAEREAYHTDGTIPSDALVIPLEANYKNPNPVAFQGSNKYVGSWVNYTESVQWADTSVTDHPSASWALRKGFDTSPATGIQPADSSDNIPGSTNPVSNPAGNWHNDAPQVKINFNPGLIKEITDSYTEGGNTFDEDNPETLTNAGFETGDLSGWTQTNASIENTIIHDGLYSAKLDGSLAEATLEQDDFTPIKDAVYSLTFWAYQPDITYTGGTVELGGVSNSLVCSTAATWEQFTLTVKATDNSKLIFKTGATLGNIIYIDDVTITRIDGSGNDYDFGDTMDGDYFRKNEQNGRENKYLIKKKE